MQHALPVAPLYNGPSLVLTSCNPTQPVFTQNIPQTEARRFAFFTTSYGKFSLKIIWLIRLSVTLSRDMGF